MRAVQVSHQCLTHLAQFPPPLSPPADSAQVITAQYFAWFVPLLCAGALLPPPGPTATALPPQARWLGQAAVGVGASWVASLALWLWLAFRLEFHGGQARCMGAPLIACLVSPPRRVAGSH